MAEMTLSVDIETFSSNDLIKSGVYSYTSAPDFTILLFGYHWKGKTEVIDLAQGEKIPQEILNLLTDENVIKSAFNAQFERVCLNAYLKTELPINQWQCTSVKSSMIGLPHDLNRVSAILKLKTQKDASGKTLIRYFSIPCKPTKKNGGRTRNLPEHDPEAWEEFKSYCKQDVDVEVELIKELSKYNTPKHELAVFHKDQQINDKGMMVDLEFAQACIDIDEVVKAEHVEEMRSLTGIDNPNSVAQIKAWLKAETGVTATSLTKDTVKKLIDMGVSDKVKRVLELRQLLGKTSTKKYQAMINSACPDQRVRGLLHFYGANRTGRWAGRILQIQNLPQNHIPDLDTARQLVRDRDIDTLRMLYGSVPNVLSQLIRTALIAKEGHTFVVADFSAIEARVIAWLAQEKWRLDVFKGHGKIYEASASAAFGIPIEQVTKGSEWRKKGKVMELACIAEGELVLTSRGLIPIEKVGKNLLVWDGENFVPHGGVIYKGKKEVIEYEGLRATEDHLVWVERQSRPIPLGEAAKSGQRLLQTGNGGNAVRVGPYNIPGEEIHSGVERRLCRSRVHRVRVQKMDMLCKPHTRKDQRVPKLLTTKTATKVARKEVGCRKTKMQQSERRELPQLWGQRNRVPVRQYFTSRTLDNGERHWLVEGFRARQDRHEWTLRALEHTVRFKGRKPSKPERFSSELLGSRGVALRVFGSDEEIESRNDARRDFQRCGNCCVRKKEELAGYKKEVRTYDILNAGPLNRFTVSNKLVHNCGFQGGVGAIKQMGGEEMGLSENDMKELVDRWRGASKNIVRFWYDVERCVMKAIGGEPQTLRNIHFYMENACLHIRLPSGRCLVYRSPALEDHPKFDGKQAITFFGLNQTTKNYEKQYTYGGKLVENIVQGTARDCLAEILLKIQDMTTAHIHDEVILEAPEERADEILKKVINLMGKEISWAKGLPLAGDGYITKYYKKD